MKDLNHRIQVLTKTFYNLNIYIEKNQLFYVLTFEGNYNNILNSNKVFLAKFEEMRSCMYHTVAANAGMGLVLPVCACSAGSENCFSHVQESLQNLTCDESFSRYPMLTCIFLGCVIIMAKISLERIGTQSEGNDLKFRELSGGIQLINCWRDTLSILNFLFNNTKLVN